MKSSRLFIPSAALLTIVGSLGAQAPAARKVEAVGHGEASRAKAESPSAQAFKADGGGLSGKAKVTPSLKSGGVSSKRKAFGKMK